MSVIALTSKTAFVKKRDKNLSVSDGKLLDDLIGIGFSFTLAGPTDAQLVEGDPYLCRVSCRGFFKNPDKANESVSYSAVSNMTVMGTFGDFMKDLRSRLEAGVHISGTNEEPRLWYQFNKETKLLEKIEIPAPQ